ncbi:MAG: TonB family protein [Micropepsaceae bacterium]
MNVAQPRSSIWSPPVVLFAIVLHAVIFYFVAVSFRIVPPPPDIFEPPTIRTVTFTPPPPTLEAEPEPIIKRPVFEQRPTPTPPVASTVPPTPFTPTVAPSQTGPTSIDVQQPISETPISQSLPRYPVAAQERGIEGRVVMSITIMPDGSVRDVRVVSAQPRGTFESTAVRAVQSWRYRPSNVTRTNVIVHMDFELRDT